MEPAAADREVVFDRLDRYVARSMAAERTPGMAVALTDRDRPLRVATYGFADLAARVPVAAETLFEIGSIGKSFTALALLRLREQGRVDLDAPVTAYLPWFAVGGATAPITLHHLLTHTAGIVAGMDATPDARSEVWALRETGVGGPPGERFHYSNVGYKALGLVLERVTGEPYRETVRRLLAEIGMDASEPAITHAVRPRLAVGYAPLHDDRPPLPTRPLVPATWLETDTADGSIAATAADLASYLRRLLNRGAGPRGRVLSEESFAAMIRPVVPAWGGGYGYGLWVGEVDGHREIGHPGGMVGYSAALRGDLDAGLGAVALCNGPGAPFAATRHAVALLRAVRAGAALPEEGEAKDRPDAADFAGRYVAASGDGAKTFTVTSAGGGLAVARGATAVPAVHLRDDDFVADDPAFDRCALRFERDEGRVVGAVHGPDRYAAEESGAAAGGSGPEPPAAWAAYPGAYRSHNPWIPFFRVVLRDGALRLLFPTGEPDGFEDDQPLVPLDGGAFRVGEDEVGPERLRFAAVVDGVALRATLSGADYWRSPTP